MPGPKTVVWSGIFEKEVKKVKDRRLKERIRKQVQRIRDNPDAGKPLRFALKGERTVYIKPYRLIYAVAGDEIIFLRFEHREKVYAASDIGGNFGTIDKGRAKAWLDEIGDSRASAGRKGLY